MLRLSLAQMRRSAGRLVAAGIAIAIGTAFVAAALFGGSVINATTAQSLPASLGDADVVIAGWHETNEDFRNNVEELPGVEAARSEEHTSALQSRGQLLCRRLLGADHG